MSPSEHIYFFLIGVPVVVAIIFIWFIFRKRKRVAIVFTSVLVIGYIGYYAYYPTLNMNKHAQGYEQVVHYVTEKYPDRMFTISPEHYEPGYTVGDFKVNDVETPMIGVTLRADKEGQVTQTGYWSNFDYPTQQELWRDIELSDGEPYTLDKDIADVTKEDEWVDGELTAFALTINDKPAIALYTYSKAGYSLLEYQKEEHEGFVVLENSGYVFTYVDERYPGETVTVHLKDDKDYILNVSQQKGRLIIEKQR